MFPSDYRQHVQRIIDSKEFGRSEAYARLLTYIVEKSVKEDIPKESTIAMEVFGKGPDFNSSEDTLVRVYMHNLRKKLGTYYQQSGSQERYHLVILKGKYQGIFFPKSELEEHEKEKEFSSPWKSTLGVLVLLSLGLCCSLAYNIYQAQHGRTSLPFEEEIERSELWRALLESREPINLVLGDIFVFDEYDSVLDRSRTIRDALINSEQELDSVVEKIDPLAERRPSVSPNPLLMKAHALGLASLAPIMEVYGGGASPRLISRMVSENFQEGPMVYMGMFKSLGPLAYVFESSRFSLLPNLNGLMHRPDSLLLEGSGAHTAHHTDVAYFSQRKGPNGNTIWILAALTDTGMLQISQKLSDLESLPQFEAMLKQELGNFPEEWEAVFWVKGFDRTHLEMELAFAYPLR